MPIPPNASKTAKQQLSPHKVRASLKYSIADGSANSAKEGFGNAFLIPYAISLKASTTMIGVIASLPELAGALFQFGSASLVEKLRSRKKIILFCALIQAILWLPLLFVPMIFQKYGPLLLLLFITLQAILSYTISPLWNSWMGDIVPEDERGRYFGKRNAITGIAVFIATLIAGYLLHVFSKIHIFLGFGILFGLAVISRLISAYFVSRMDDVEYVVDKKAYFSFWDFVKRMSFNNYGRFVLYMCLLNFAVYLAAPFFTVYMLEELKLDYMTFTLITLASLIASFIGMYLWGRYNDEHGSKSLLFINGILIAFVPLLWLLTKNVYWLFAIEAFSGFVWAGFNLGSANFIFDATTPQKRTRCIVYYHVLKGIFIFAGATLGGYLATHMDKIFSGKIVFSSAILVLFLISGIARLIVSFTFLPMLREMRLVEIPLGHSLIRSHVTIRPKQGIIYESVGLYKKQEEQKEQVKPAKNEPLKKNPKLPLKPLKIVKKTENATATKNISAKTLTAKSAISTKPTINTKTTTSTKTAAPTSKASGKAAAIFAEEKEKEKEKAGKQTIDYLQRQMRK